MAELVDMIEQIDQQDYDYIKRGIDVNLRMSEAGYSLRKVSFYISQLVGKKQRSADLSSSCEIITSSAADARMGGLNQPVMSSGGSGNQGIVAILVSYLVGRHYKINEEIIIRSIALSHLMNSYIKCFTGAICPLYAGARLLQGLAQVLPSSINGQGKI
jgi:L-cysteine desulfidase